MPFLLRLPMIALVLAGAPASPALADCSLDLRLLNGGAHPVSVRVNDVEVRSRTGVAGVLQAWGPWRRASRGGWFDTQARLDIAPGTSVRDGFVGDFACSDARQLRATYRCEGGPSAGSSHSRSAGAPMTQQGIIALSVGQNC